MGRRSAWSEAAIDLAPDQFFGSSDDFAKHLRNEHPELLVPEHEIVYIGYSMAWDASKENPHTAGTTCPHAARIKPGSLLCCPQCQHSGFERRLAQQRELAGLPPKEPATASASQSLPSQAPKKPAKRLARPPKMQRWWRDAAWQKN